VASRFVPKPTLGETARRSEDQLQNHPAIRDERHQEAQHTAQDHGRDLAVLDVHRDEHEVLDHQDRDSQDRQRRLPMERGGDDEPAPSTRALGCPATTRRLGCSQQELRVE
jgi:hypothetical protein